MLPNVMIYTSPQSAEERITKFQGNKLYKMKVYALFTLVKVDSKEKRFSAHSLLVTKKIANPKSLHNFT